MTFFSKLKIEFFQYLVIAFLILLCLSFSKFGYNKSIPKDGYVPNQETAIKIAEAIWTPLFGEKVLYFKPYEVTLKNDSIWVVEGTLKDDSKGGVPYIEINKKDCKILLVSHGK
ncbi:MAG: hypothetical protein CFE21_22800 [Bacteroidetes bacterium B1(2017)]|nr:MAG: hypothetical protein CFE21_22800 [Bacteroidetes bacterium B1(2017)]